MIISPPRLALWLLRLALPAERCETISGDLEEVFRTTILPRAGPRAARRWFWRQAISVAFAWRFSRRSRPFMTPSRRGHSMQGLRQDFRYAIRSLAKAPAFTLIAIMTLALGIGANSAIFTLVNALLLKPLPFEKPDELMLVHLLAPDREAGPEALRELVWSYPKYEVFRARQQAFADHAIFKGSEWSLTGTGEAARVRGEVIGARYLSTLGIAPHIGRDFTAAEDRVAGGDPVAMLGYEIWQQRFGGDPSVLGRTVRLDATPYTIVGVLPPGFRGLTGEAQLWLPVSSLAPRDLAAKWNHWAYVVARRGAGVSAAQARSMVSLLGPRIDEEVGRPAGKGMPKIGATAAPLDQARVDPLIKRSALVLLGAVGLVLLIGCVNLASLMIARGASRQREVAVRLAIGATRGRLVRQSLVESLLLAGVGAAAGLAIAAGALQLAGLLMPEAGLVLRSRTFGLTRVGMGMIGVDLGTFAFTLITAVATALLFGLLPAWQASRADIVQTIKAGGAGSIGPGARGIGASGRWMRGIGARQLLIVGETALALVLLVASGLMLQSVRNLQRTELGFDHEGLVTLRLQLPDAQYDAARSTRFFTELLQRVRTVPGVRAAAYGSCAPVSGACDITSATLPDRPDEPAALRPLTGIQYASPSLFETAGMRVLKGRAFTDRDVDGQPRVVMINETFARELFPGQDPIGKRIALGIGGGFEQGAEIVGVVNDVRYRAVETAATPDSYVPLLQRPRMGGLLFVRADLDLAAIAPALRQEIASLDRDLPVSDLKTMRARVGDATWRTRLSADLLALFAGLALLLAAIGLYGLMAQAVAQRTREIGVRLALGAERASIFRLVIGRALAIAAAGIVIGVGLSLFSMPLLETLLFRVTPGDPLTLAVLAAGLLAVSLIASYVPARRAMRVDPLTSLRSE